MLKHVFKDSQTIFRNLEGIDTAKIAKAARVAQVRNIWRDLVEPLILDHTNAVFIFEEDGRRKMHVYVDESIYAAELNNRRELLKLLCLERHGEQIDDFLIHISRGIYKRQYPFRETNESSSVNTPTNVRVHLSENEISVIDETCAKIPDPKLRAQFRKAMISDLEWKKSE